MMWFARMVLVLAGLCSAYGWAAERSVAEARARALGGKRIEALRMLDEILREDPVDSDALTLRGTVLSWEGRFDEARRDLEQVLARKRDHGDALPALVGMELWADQPQRADELARDALVRNPQNTTLLYLRARALRNLNRRAESVKLLRRLIEIDPRHQEGAQMLDGFKEELRGWEAGVSHGVSWFSDGRTPWRETQASLYKKTRLGTVGATFWRADRFGLHSHQAELEMYPRIRPGTYAYVGASYSFDANLYARYRLDAELFQGVGHGFEISGGLRRLGFRSNVDVYTGSVTRYRGDWMFTLRAFLTPDSVGTSRSFQLNARRYFGDGRDFIGVRVGRGSSPVETRTTQDIEILDSSSLTMEWRQRLAGGLGINIRAGINREDRLYRAGLKRYVADGGIDYRF